MSERALRIGIDGRELEGRSTGVGRYLRSLLRRFAEDGRHEFVVYSASPVLRPVESSRIDWRVLRGGHPLVWEQRVLPAVLGGDRIDVMFSPAYSCPLLVSIPRVTAIHDLSFFARREEFGPTHGWRRRVMARLSASVSRSILVFSEFTRGEMLRYLGPRSARKTEVVLHGPDDDLPKGPARSEAREALGLDPTDRYVITVGTVLRRRNVSTLVRSVARLRERLPGLRLGIVGDNRSHPYEDIGALVRSLGCEREVCLSGFVTDGDVARHYAAADAAVFLSEYEGFGLPALEAMSRGVPTLIADRGSQNELFAAGTLVVEPDEAAVVDALDRVLSDTATSADIRRRGLERATAFSWERAAAETLRIVERAAS